ncbi:hypothetical protein I3760_01G008000 [Carya illinoinensis]|nr:hypothetical protein I3760_01G008000 [Carya illinoinensis]
MEINCGRQTWPEHSDSEQDQLAEEDEDLSFCDLPVISYFTKEDDGQSRKEDASAAETQELEFDFGAKGGSTLKESEMCAADEVFFQGRILPLRVSVSSDTGLTLFRHASNQKISTQCISRSESLDHGSMGTGSGSNSNNSSRSSSTRSSHNSLGSCTTGSTYTIERTSKQTRLQNHLLSCPSPKPQVRLSNTRQGSLGSRSQNSSSWDYLRLGLVPTPEIEMLDPKVRRSSSVNKSASGSRNIRVTSDKSCYDSNMVEQRRPAGFLEKRIGRLLSGCKCTEAVSSNVVIIKSNANVATQTKKENLVGLKLRRKQLQEQKQQGKQAMSSHRTLEWIKELSHAGLLAP